MNKRQLKKRKDKYDRLMIKLKPNIDQLSKDLAEFHNCSVEQATEGLLMNWNRSTVEDLRDLGVHI